MIYLDNAATTKILPDVLDAMMPYLTDEYGNPSSIYKLGQRSKKAIEDARIKVANAMGALPREIFFTSCGTESDNWAIRGVAKIGSKQNKRHIITSTFEHHAVLHTVEDLEKEGYEVTYLPVYDDGVVRVEDLIGAIREDTCLVTVMYANNEIGTVQPISEIGKICRDRNIIFHTDAVQAMGSLDVNVCRLQVDMLSISGHKFHAPKGVGVLYVRSGINIPSFIFGGAQESGKRAGTENVASIVGLGHAVEIAVQELNSKTERISALRNKLIEGVLTTIPKSRLNGSREYRLPGNTNFSFEGIEGESLLLMLQQHDICASSGSACTSGSLDPSHVLLSIGLTHEIAHGSLRMTISRFNTEEEIDKVLEVLPPIVAKLRTISPLWECINDNFVSE